jgi:CBS domain-containing protein
MEVGDVCSRDVYIVRPDEPLADAAREMDKRHIGAVVVVESRDEVVRPVGIVTDRDIVCGQIDRNKDLFRLTVGEVMTPRPLSFEESDDAAQALQGMSAKAVRRAPVVNSAGELVGIVTFDDLLPVVADELTALAKLIGTQARAER